MPRPHVHSLRLHAAWLALVLALAAGPANVQARTSTRAPASGRFGQSFEGEAALSYGNAIFRYYRPVKGQVLDRGVLTKVAPELVAGANRRRVRWQDLGDATKASYLTTLFEEKTREKLLPDFLNVKRPDLDLSPEKWATLSREARLSLITYRNLNQRGQKRFKEIMREVFPMHRGGRVPGAFEDTLFWEAPNTYELRHRSKTDRPAEVNRSIRWMKKHISDRVRPHEHVSFRPDLAGLRARRKEFLSFLQRIDLVSFAERLEHRSLGALHGSYGKNFMPYSASKLAEIDRSLTEGTYSLLLGSKLHGVGLRTYHDGTIGLEVRAVTDPAGISWAARVIRRAIGKGALGDIAYDERPIEFAPVGSRIASRVGRALGERGDTAALGTRIDHELAAAGLDARLSFPLLTWETQRFVPAAKHALIASERARFSDALTSLLSLRIRGVITAERLREGAMAATWRFAEVCALSADLRRSVQPRLPRGGALPSLIAGD